MNKNAHLIEIKLKITKLYWKIKCKSLLKKIGYIENLSETKKISTKILVQNENTLFIHLNILKDLDKQSHKCVP